VGFALLGDLQAIFLASEVATGCCCARFFRSFNVLALVLKLAGDVTMLAGHQQEIQAERDRKLEAAREQRKNRRQRAA
jgi:hypothetical protein